MKRRILALSVLCLAIALAALAGSTPTNPCGTGADVAFAGGVAWTTPTHICLAGNGNYAVVLLPSLGHSDYLSATNFGFSVPGGATILGVQMSFYGTAQIGGVIADQGIFITKDAATVTGNDHSNIGFWTSGLGGLRSYGSNSDIWGATLAPADVNSANFGVFIKAGNQNNVQSFSTLVGQQAVVTMTVTYSSQSTGFAPGIIGTYSQTRSAML